MSTTPTLVHIGYPKAASTLLRYRIFRNHPDIDFLGTKNGNREFDRSLRARDPALGLRDVNDVAACAAEHGFTLEEVVEMPANNRSLVFRLG